jgi:hypothetical protein
MAVIDEVKFQPISLVPPFRAAKTISSYDESYLNPWVSSAGTYLFPRRRDR